MKEQLPTVITSIHRWKSTAICHAIQQPSPIDLDFFGAPTFQNPSDLLQQPNPTQPQALQVQPPQPDLPLLDLQTANEELQAPQQAY